MSREWSVPAALLLSRSRQRVLSARLAQVLQATPAHVRDSRVQASRTPPGRVQVNRTLPAQMVVHPTWPMAVIRR